MATQAARACCISVRAVVTDRCNFKKPPTHSGVCSALRQFLFLVKMLIEDVGGVDCGASRAARMLEAAVEGGMFLSHHYRFLLRYRVEG